MPIHRITRRTLLAAMAVTPGVMMVPGSTLAQGTPAASPVAEAAIPARHLEAIRTAIQEVMESEGIPGAAVLLDIPGYQPFMEPFGVADKAAGTPVSLDTHFRIGSITKTFVGMVILQLVDEGELSLDDPIATWDFDLPNADQITVRHLLNMSSGLVNYTDTQQFSEFLALDPTADISIEEILDLANAEPLFAPGEMYAYSNTNYVVLGLIAEQVTGEDLEAVLQERIFGPFGLAHTGFTESIPEPFARGYGDINAEVPPELADQVPASPVADPIASPVVDYPVDDDGHFDTTSFNPGWAWAAGEAWSTVGDLSIWLPALLAGESLSADLAESRFDWVVADPEHPEYGGYGLGIADLGGLIGHNGAIPGYTSIAVSEPNIGLSIVVLTNLYPGSNLLITPDAQIANAAIEAAIPLLMG